MGIYTEYLDRRLDFGALQAERKDQLKRISKARGGRAILTYAAAMKKSNCLRPPHPSERRAKYLYNAKKSKKGP